MTTGNRTITGPLVANPACGGSWEAFHDLTNWTGGDRVAGEPKGTPHNYIRNWDVFRTGYMRKDSNGTIGPVPNCIGSYLHTSQPVYGETEKQQLLSKLREKLRGGSINMGVFLGTQDQNFRAVAQNFKQLRAGWRAVANGGSKRQIFDALESGRLDRKIELPKLTVKQKQEHLANRWLEYSYGWAPLVQDVHEILMKQCAVYDDVVEHVTRSSWVRKNSDLVPAGTGMSWQREYLLRVGLKVTTRPETSMLNRLVLSGYLDPASLLWERLPWSFVIDWALPVQNYLENLLFFNRLTYSAERTILRSQRSLPVQTGYSGFTLVSSGFSTKGQFIRTVKFDLGGAVTLPRLKNPFSSNWQRAANAVSLFVQLRR